MKHLHLRPFEVLFNHLLKIIVLTLISKIPFYTFALQFSIDYLYIYLVSTVHVITIYFIKDDILNYQLTGMNRYNFFDFFWNKT